MSKLKVLTTAIIIGLLVSSHPMQAASTQTKVTRGDFISRVVDGDYAKILKGYPDGDYHLELPITREQAAIVVASVARVDGIRPVSQNHYPDLHNAAYWAMADVQYAADLGVIRTDSWGMLLPSYYLTQGEFEYIVSKLNDLKV